MGKSEGCLSEQLCKVDRPNKVQTINVLLVKTNCCNIFLYKITLKSAE